MGSPDDDRAEDRDALRRRLYRPGATTADVERYRRRTRAGRGWAVAVTGAVVVVVGVAALVGGFVGGFVVTGAPAARTASPAARTASAWVVVVAASQRQRFAAALARGDGAGLAAWFFANPASLPGELRTTTRADSQEYDGTGRGTVELHPTALADHGGRLTVVVVTDRDGDLAWRAGALPASALPLTAGLPESTTVHYDGAAPTRLTVTAGAHVRWGLLATLTD